jgi:hypothetical protein
VSLGIVGSAGHHATGTSYHIGWSSLKTTAYSRQHPRDVKLKTEAASAFDIGWFTKGDLSLVGLTKWMVAEARAGRRPDTREVIGPGGDGRAYRWAHENGWKAQLRTAGDSHETHTHESYYRDSENSDKIRYFRGYFEGDDMPIDDADVNKIWNRDDIVKAPEGYSSSNTHWTAANVLRSAQYHARLGYEQNQELLAGQQAVLAAVAGKDVVTAVKAELAKHDKAVSDRLAEIAVLVGQSGTVPAEQIVDEIARRLAGQD